MIEFIFETSINLIETLITTDFITRYLGNKYTGKKGILAFVACWMIAFIQMCIMNHITVLETLGAYIPIVIYFIYALFFLNGSIWLKLWMSMITYLIVYIIAVVTNLTICHIIGYNPIDMITVFNSTRIIGVVITKIILFYTTRIILRNKYKNPMSKYKWFMLIFLPLISLISLGALMKAALYNEEIKSFILIGMACIVLADVMTYYYFVVINREYENILRTKLLQMQNENLKNDIADKEAFLKEMKSVRHDIKNQLLTISGYAQAGKTEEITEYINILTNSYLPSILNYISTGNSAFDAIINSKIAICNQKKIFMEINIKNGTVISLNPAEIAVLFGNLLDNAIEAAEQTAEKRISIDIQTNNDYLIILICNSIESDVLKHNENLATSKANKEMHGIGIKSIRSIVNKHNGMIDFYEEKNEFCCHIMIDKVE